MRALVVRSYAGGAASLALEDIEQPKPAPGQVLIKVARSPINPNDLLALRNAYEVPKPVGCVAGFEGSGTVVDGNGFLARMMKGRRVAFSAAKGSGAWAEYALAGAFECAPLSKAVGDDEGAMMLTNPLTAMVLVSRAQAEGHRAVVQAAAAGALGKMVARLARERGLPMIHLVRRSEQKKELDGCEVIDTSQAGYEKVLAERCAQVGATLALDPVGGAMTGVLLKALAEGGVVRVYGALSGQPSQLDNDDLVFRRKRVEGFTMYEWVQGTSLPGKLMTLSKVQRALKGPLATDVRAREPLEKFQEALDAYQRTMSGGKILFEIK